MKQPKIVLPANVFDALELSALANGGIGSTCLRQEEFNGKETGAQTFMRPVCIIGHGLFLDGMLRGVPDGKRPGKVVGALAKAFGFGREEYEKVYGENDVPVSRFLEKKHGSSSKHVERNNDDGDVCSLDVERKVTWKKWCKLVGVVRGE